jgi:hypothetical protein
MAEYASGYADRTAWMHQSGVDMIRAAVLAQAVQDYVEACKTITALSGQITGKNVERARKRRANHYLWTWNRMNLSMPQEEFLMENFYRLSIQAQKQADEVERFFLGQDFLLFCDNSTGQEFLKYAQDYVREWAEDKNSGRMGLTYRPVENNPGYAAAIKKSRKRGRPRKTPK